MIYKDRGVAADLSLIFIAGNGIRPFVGSTDSRVRRTVAIDTPSPRAAKKPRRFDRKVLNHV